MSFTESEASEAQKFLDFYVDKLEHHRHLFQYHLAEEVVLDWFGQTVKGEKKVTEFLKVTVAAVSHLLGDARPAKKIGFRDSHNVRVPRIPKAIPIGLMSPPRTFILKTQAKTPKKQSIPSTSSHRPLREPRQGLKVENKGDLKANEGGTKVDGGIKLDGGTKVDGGTPPRRTAGGFPSSPVKKMKTAGGHLVRRENADSDCETVEEEQHDAAQKLRFAVSEGALEFRKPSSKRYQIETKWRRPCKLSVAYTTTSCGEYAIYLIIYEGNARCRRNLMKDFEAEEPEN